MIEPPRFPLEDHFKWSKSHTLPKDDIKAGCLEGRTLYTYTSAHFRDGKHWWTQVNPDILLDEVKSWIQTKATEVKTGEVVLVYVVGHCTKDDEVRIGNKPRDVAESVQLVGTAGFKKRRRNRQYFRILSIWNLPQCQIHAV
ncbi:hypothetical protein N7476_007440 [Penicillium atrosanguineum]|uniref:Uncharacterized protein n=1 Tax=Penicillium atrosanguineum TaxID=1132637 RepID=A0A9W9PUI5_9EURO|nr:hypothetical protein N7526_006989 [Penicillium atrosanguineum]KAJ5311580.1 hypothetical protein N7476_007440 [Penicillium atrosanguineum]